MRKAHCGDLVSLCECTLSRFFFSLFFWGGGGLGLGLIGDLDSCTEDDRVQVPSAGWRGR